MPYLTMREKPKATTKPWFSRLLRHPARKQRGSILGHKTHTPDPHEEDVKKKTPLRYHLLALHSTMPMASKTTSHRRAPAARRTDPVLCSACSQRVTTMWVNRPLQVRQLGQLSLSSFRVRYIE